MSLTLGNGTITSYSYHDDDALATLSHNANGAADDVDWTYGFNKVNQLTSKILSGGANLALYKWEPQYKKTDAYTANGLNQYSSVAGTSLTYDAAGNLTSDGVWIYGYDVENMLLNASKPGVSASYIYDPLGRRSAKTVDAVLTTFLHDGVEEVADYNSAGTLLRRYVHGPGVDEYLVMYTGPGTTSKSYFHANHQGSIVAMSDASGTVTEQHSYDAYGNSDELTGNPFRYTGRRLDAETGLYYYRARYYSPAIGRFLQTDPIGYGDGLNWYTYVGNDPHNNTDPMGLSRIEEYKKQKLEKTQKEFVKDMEKAFKSLSENNSFSSADEAAGAFGKAFGKIAEKYQMEIGVNIYKSGNTFSVSSPVTSFAKVINRSEFSQEASDSGFKGTDRQNWTSLAHTHPDFGRGYIPEKLSSGDIKSSILMRRSIYATFGNNKATVFRYNAWEKAASPYRDKFGLSTDPIVFSRDFIGRYVQGLNF